MRINCASSNFRGPLKQILPKMTTQEGGCLFQIGYWFYTRTCLGYIYHRRDVNKAREKYGEGESHSVIQTKTYNDLKITPVPMSLDNLAYVITDGKTTVVIDPGDPEPVNEYLEKNNLTPDAVLVTHKHWDHSGGNSEMKKKYRKIKIYGSASDNINNVTNGVTNGEELMFETMKFTCHLSPGHTTGHMYFVLDGSPYRAPDSVFSGDHLFLGGCGRMFEKPAFSMLKSLDEISDLPPDTLVWPGHEYASDNLEFACHVEPSNEKAKEKLIWVKEQRLKKMCTCPSTMGEELTYNPFLRTKEKTIMVAAGALFEGEYKVPDDDARAQALFELRQMKDKYKYKL